MRPQTKILLGGREVDHTADRILRRLPFVTIVRGEGERAFRDLLLAWLGEPAPTVVGGVSYLADGKPVHNPRTGYLDSLDEIPFAYQDCLAEVTISVDHFPNWPRVQYESTRGCPYKCTFCLYGKLPAVSYRSPRHVIAELSELLKRGLTVEIVDPVFALHKKRTREILRGLADRDFPGTMTVETYAELLDEEMIDLMARAGVAYVGVGLQSVDPTALKTMQRRLDDRKYRRSIELLKQAGIEFYVDLIYGLPGSDYAAFKRTIDYVYSMGVSRIQMYRLLMLPGSEMTRDAAKHHIKYNPLPPYELMGHASFPFADVMRASRLAESYRLLMGRLERDGLMERLTEFTSSPANLIESVADKLLRNGFNFLDPSLSTSVDIVETFCEQIGHPLPWTYGNS